MNTSPTVSVVIPTYNREHLVMRAIRSVVSQTFKDWELLVVDDGSKDNTEDAVQSFGDPRIRFIKHEINKGECATRNTGIVAATGGYLAFLDSDDEWLPEKLEKQVELLDSLADDWGRASDTNDTPSTGSRSRTVDLRCSTLRFTHLERRPELQRACVCLREARLKDSTRFAAGSVPGASRCAESLRILEYNAR